MEINEQFREPNHREYSNNEITVYWKPELCIHATTCFTDLPNVFNPRKRPWVNINGAPADQIARIVTECPTGALAYKLHTQTTAENPAAPQAKPAEIKVIKDGPYIVDGKFILLNPDGKKIKENDKIALCRCGGTHNSPFCDGTHKRIGFKRD